MPGVLMLQTLVEAGSWLLRVTEDFRHSIIALREAKNVKYGTFMQPGGRMELAAEIVELGNGVASLKGKGEVAGNMTVSARYTLQRYNLADRDPALRTVDEAIVKHLRGQYLMLSGVGLRRSGSTAP
jgi:3-hydroxyacyl-[acyl-carrier-protein] dehydratase